MFQGVAHWRAGNFDTAFAIVSDESPISAGATFYIVDASNGLMKALTSFAVGRAAVEINQPLRLARNIINELKFQAGVM
jgi:hypothetical protein